MNNREVKRRIASVKETVKITRAMYAISVAKMVKAKSALPLTEQFYENALSIMEKAASSSAPYFAERGSKTAFIVIGSDKGLCGDYNQRVFEKAQEVMRQVSEKFLFTVGSVTKEMLAKVGLEADVEFLHSAEDPSPESAYSMAEDLLNLYEEGLLDRVLLVYSKATANHSEPVVKSLLPYIAEQNLPAPQEGITESAVRKSVYEYLAGALYNGLWSSSLSEHIARVKAMMQATKNGEAMIADLTAKYNKIRQESITRSLQDAACSDQGL